MRCINCECVVRKNPCQYYFCSSTCWEDAKTNSPWRILSEGVGLFTSCGPSVLPAHPEFARRRRRIRRAGRLEIRYAPLQEC